MKQNLSFSSRDLARLKRRENAGYNLYSPIFVGNKPVAIAKFMAEDAIPIASLEMALADKAENSSLPFFYIRHDADFIRFQVSPGNVLACSFLSTTKTLSEDGLAGLFEYCSNR